MNKLFLMIMILFPFFSQAEIYSTGKFENYIVSLESEKPIEIILQKEFETSDSCNHFSILGHFRSIAEPEDSLSQRKSYLGDFNVNQTLIGCPPSIRSRSISLKTEKLKIEPVEGRIYVQILVPVELELKVLE